MKLFIASDIHGSAFYCEKMLAAYTAEKAERLLLLGDLLYHGPRNDLPKDYDPNRVIQMLSSFKNDIIAVCGNCDSEVDQMVLPFPITAKYTAVAFDDHLLFATHGHTYNELSPLPMKKGDVLLLGHTHVPKCTEKDGFVFINPGSVSLPKENSPHSYIVFENGVFTWKELGADEYMEYRL